MRPGNLALLAALTVAQGLAQSSGNLMLRSMVADIADVQKLRSGEERCGLLFSVFNVTSHAGLALAVGLAFPLVSWLGFVPGQANTPEAMDRLLLVFALGPALAHGMSALLVRRFDLDEHRHAEVRRQLDARAAMASAPSYSLAPSLHPPGGLPGNAVGAVAQR